MTTFVPPPNTPTTIEHKVCPEHGLEASGEIGCFCEANYDSDLVCVCDRVGKLWCGICGTLVENPTTVVYMIAGVVAPTRKEQP